MTSTRPPIQHNYVLVIAQPRVGRSSRMPCLRYCDRSRIGLASPQLLLVPRRLRYPRGARSGVWAPRRRLQRSHQPARWTLDIAVRLRVRLAKVCVRGPRPQRAQQCAQRICEQRSRPHCRTIAALAPIASALAWSGLLSLTFVARRAVALARSCHPRRTAASSRTARPAVASLTRLWATAATRASCRRCATRSSSARRRSRRAARRRCR